MPWDHHKYIFMATHSVLQFHVAPYCRRILVPYLAGIMPLPLTDAFLVIAMTSVALTGVAAYCIGRLVTGRASVGCALLMFYFSLSWATKYNIRDFWLTDAFGLCVMTWAVVAILARADAAFMVMIAVGVAAKESVLFVVALHYGLNAVRIWDSRAAIRSLLVAVPALVVLSAIRIAIPAWNGNREYMNSLPLTLSLVQPGLHGYGLADVFRLNVERRCGEFLHFWPYRAFSIGTFGVPLCILSLSSAVYDRRRLVRLLAFFVLVYAQLLFAGNGERLIVAAFPAILILAASSVERIGEKLRLPDWIIGLAPSVFIGATLLDSKDIMPPLSVQFELTLAVTLTLYAVSALSKRASGGPSSGLVPGGACAPADGARQFSEL